MDEKRRLFFGLEIIAPWPKNLPTGRKLTEENRHLTLAFLGNVSYPKVASLLPAFPKPPFNVGVVGSFDQVELLPPLHPNVISWHIQWQENEVLLCSFQQSLTSWLKGAGLNTQDSHRPWLPHVTLCRRPFHQQEWIDHFHPLPLFATHIHLFQSLGELQYQPLWTYPIKPPFVEVPHPTDLAFKINSESLPQLFLHAKTALAFHDPRFLMLKDNPAVSSLDAIIAALNEIIRRLHQTGGCYFSSISHHGKAHRQQDGTLQWLLLAKR